MTQALPATRPGQGQGPAPVGLVPRSTAHRVTPGAARTGARRPWRRAGHGARSGPGSRWPWPVGAVAAAPGWCGPSSPSWWPSRSVPSYCRRSCPGCSARAAPGSRFSSITQALQGQAFQGLFNSIWVSCPGLRPGHGHRWRPGLVDHAHQHRGPALWPGLMWALLLVPTYLMAEGWQYLLEPHGVLYPVRPIQPLGQPHFLQPRRRGLRRLAGHRSVRLPDHVGGARGPGQPVRGGGAGTRRRPVGHRPGWWCRCWRRRCWPRSPWCSSRR